MFHDAMNKKCSEPLCLPEILGNKLGTICHSCSEPGHQGTMCQKHVKYEMAPYSQDNPPMSPTREKRKTLWRYQRSLIINYYKIGYFCLATEPQAPPNCFSLGSVLRKEFFKSMIKHHLSFTTAVF
jgi:hypothetical protein